MGKQRAATLQVHDGEIGASLATVSSLASAVAWQFQLSSSSRSALKGMVTDQASVPAP